MKRKSKKELMMNANLFHEFCGKNCLHPDWLCILFIRVMLFVGAASGKMIRILTLINKERVCIIY